VRGAGAWAKYNNEVINLFIFDYSSIYERFLTTFTTIKIINIVNH